MEYNVCREIVVRTINCHYIAERFSASLKLRETPTMVLTTCGQVVSIPNTASSM